MGLQIRKSWSVAGGLLRKGAMEQKKRKMRGSPDDIRTYFRNEKSLLVLITITGILYNAGMTAGPWFEGQMAQMLCDIIQKTRVPEEMVRLAATYVLVILFVQGMRYFKRLFIRRFANEISRDMKETLYQNLLSSSDAGGENAGSLLTKAIADADACTEGIRKFTTEIFDTGVVMAAYLVMLLSYDWRLTLLVMIFPPFAYLIAAKLRGYVAKVSAQGKESEARLNQATLDRVSNAMTYRVYGEETRRNLLYEEVLTDYERKEARANLLVSSVQPLYQIIASISVVLILWLGGRNVAGNGWTAWNIAAFSTFLACFTKLAAKSSKAAKLFNAVQKAQVSWRRIKPFLKETRLPEVTETAPCRTLQVKDVSFSYDAGHPVFSHLTFAAQPGEIIGVTGEVASGKSSLGRLFLPGSSYTGEIDWGEEDWHACMNDGKSYVGYLGHQPELFSGTIEENIRLGKEGDLSQVLAEVCMDEDLKTFPDGVKTMIGDGGVRLSGGQQARIALARTLYHARPLMILDDPFSAVDPKTEAQIFSNLRAHSSGSTILLISHRLSLFSRMDQVLFLDHGSAACGTHEELMKTQPTYRELVTRQEKAGDLDE